MIDGLLLVGLQQALLLSIAIALLRMVRPLLLRQGVGFAYGAWGLVPLMLLTQALPRPPAESFGVLLTAAEGSAAVGLAAIPLPPASSSTPWLTLWLVGTLAVLVLQAWRQWRLARLGQRLPAGSSPALVGLLRPRTALPVDFEQRFTPEERELILTHEAIHRSRLDNLWNLIATLLTAMHWWNPLAWWAASRMRADQELSCDASVLRRRPGSIAAYTRALLSAHSLRAPNAPIASRWVSTHPLIERIAMLNRPQVLSRRRIALSVLCLLSTAGLAWAAQTVPAADPNAQRVYIQTEVRIGDHLSKPALVTALGVPATIGIDHGDGSGHWEIVMTVNQQPDGQLIVQTERRFGNPLKKQDGRHRQIDAAGIPIELRMPAPDGGPAFVMKRVVRLVDADFKPPR